MRILPIKILVALAPVLWLTACGGVATTSQGTDGSGGGGGPAPTVTLSATPAAITAGQSTTISWSSTDATSCSGVGSQTSTSGSVVESPATSTTYSITCTGAGGTATDSTSVTVTPVSGPTPAPTVTITASPATVAAGGSSTITWSSTDATACSGVGTATSGSTTVQPSASTSYSITCTGPGGSASGSASVTVSGTPPPVGGTLCSSALTGSHQTYDVGPGKTYTELTNVPWLSLVAGDVVNIYYRSTPYATKVALRGHGTASEPIIINGVTDANCRPPEVTGKNAVSAADIVSQQWFKSNWGIETAGTFVIFNGGYSQPITEFIQFKNLKITGAHPDNAFTDQSGAQSNYDSFAFGIYAVTVRDFLVENCEIADDAGGVFTNTKDDDPVEASYRVTIRNSWFHDNGLLNSYFVHNVYIQSVGALYEGNYIEQLRAGAEGSSLKDRSSNVVIRYNTIVSSARAIDLVETQGGANTVQTDPTYDTPWVYGNVIINDASLSNYATQPIHFGGDQGLDADYKKGPLYFYNNTVVTRISAAQEYRVSVFDLPTNQQTVQAQNNVLVSYGDTNYLMLTTQGVLNFVGKNWITAGWQVGNGGGTVNTGGGTLLTGTDPLLDPATYEPAAGSPLLNAGSALSPGSLDPVTAQFAAPRGTKSRSNNNLGAH
jgi:hypothetical protein